MPLAFLAPLFLGALSLVAVPWLIHQIRRPEREPLRFSSIMFIPKIDRKIIERRRIQHLLLRVDGEDLPRIHVLGQRDREVARPASDVRHHVMAEDGEQGYNTVGVHRRVLPGRSRLLGTV